MSSGIYDYTFAKIDGLASVIKPKGYRSAAPPTLRRAFIAHLRKVAAAAKAIEWNDSGDGDSDEADLIRAVLSPTVEIEVATEAAKEALAELVAALGRVGGEGTA